MRKPCAGSLLDFHRQAMVDCSRANERSSFFSFITRGGVSGRQAVFLKRTLLPEPGSLCLVFRYEGALATLLAGEPSVRGASHG